MKTNFLTLLPLVFLTGPVMADAETDQKQAQVEQQQLEDAQRNLEEARRKLEEAAREVAELSMQADGNWEIIREMRGKGRRAVLGINIGPAKAPGAGVRVEGVTPGGPADQAGLMAGDVITKAGDVSLAGTSGGESNRKLLKFMRDVEPGQDVKLVYERDGKTQEATVRSKASDSMAFAFAGPMDKRNVFIRRGAPDVDVDVEIFDGDAPHHWVDRGMDREFFRRWAGMEMVSLTKELGAYFGTDEGLLVVRGPGQEGMDIRDGDVITQIGGRIPDSPAHATRILRSYQPGEKLTLDIVRNKKKVKVEVTLPERKVSGINQILELELEELHELEGLDSLHEMLAPPAPPAPRESPAKT